MSKIEEEQLRQYHEDGYTVLRSLIPADLLAPLRRRIVEVMAGHHEWPAQHFQALDPERYRTPNGKLCPVSLQSPSQVDPLFKAFVEHPGLASAMATLLEGPVVRHTDQVIIKEARHPDLRTYYHQDSFYWKLQPRLGCNAWIPLDAVGPQNIALAMMPGSHRDWRLVAHEQYYDEPALYGGASKQPFKRHRIPADQVDQAKEHLVPMRPGDAVFFTNYTWHRAEPNRSGQTKIAYAIAYRLHQPPLNP